MFATNVLHANLYLGTTLAERSAIMANHTEQPLPVVAPSVQKQVEKWKEQLPFALNDYFLQRLAADGLTEDRLSAILHATGEELQLHSSTLPNWIRKVSDTYTMVSALASFDQRQDKAAFAPEKSGFLLLVQPLIDQAVAQVEVVIARLERDHSRLPFQRAIVAKIFREQCAVQLLEILKRTLVLELHVARLAGKLHSSTAEERFSDFICQLAEPAFQADLFHEYPTLARIVTTYMDDWAAAYVEFLERFAVDWPRISADWGIPTTATLSALQVGGDTHNDGRAVMIVSVKSGDSSWKIVYKPHSLALDVHFQHLLQWLNQFTSTILDQGQAADNTQDPLFRPLTVLDCGEYGWVEFLTAAPCTSVEAVKRFYQRQGCYLALLYTLSASDFHAENVIAVGEYPMLIDLETLLNPSLEQNQDEAIKAQSPTASVLNHSVLQTGLLPFYLGGNGVDGGVEVSGLGGKAGQTTSIKWLTWEAVGTDEMRLVHQQGELASEQNRPTLNGQEVNTLDYTDDIINGFTAMYRKLLEQRNALLAEEGPLTNFAGDRVRVVLRPTYHYDLLLRESYHPDLLRNAVNRDRFFDKLWINIRYAPHLAKVVADEHKALWRGDIPFFYTATNSVDLWTDNGNHLPHFFKKSGICLVHEQLQRLGEADLQQQLWFIRASLTAFVLMGEQADEQSYQLSQALQTATSEQLIKAACDVGAALQKLAWQNEAQVSWIGVSQLTGASALVRLGIDFYNGTAGIAFFFAYLGAITGQREYTDLARKAAKTLVAEIEEYHTSIKLIGGFEGWGGLIYTLTHLGALWQEKALLEKAESYAYQLPALIANDQTLDIIAGSAGCILSLLALYHQTKAPHLLDIAIQCGERLLAQAQPMSCGVGWRTHMGTVQPLTGLSHGNAGFALALLKLYAVSQDQRFYTTALAALRYEDHLFSPEAQNWPDFRLVNAGQGVQPNRPEFAHFWCHGAPGIGLARLQTLDLLDEKATQNAIAAAVHATLQAGLGKNHCLCHGDLGNLELLLQAGQRLQQPLLHQQTYQVAGAILQSIQTDGWLCGEPLGIETAGLMTGLAGIGYGLLRLAAPDRVPSVLTLEPPHL